MEKNNRVIENVSKDKQVIGKTKNATVPKKADHKHQWQKIIIEYNDYFVRSKCGNPQRHAVVADICKVCGKVGRLYFFESLGQVILPFDPESVKTRHPDLDVYEGFGMPSTWKNTSSLKLKQKSQF